MPTLVSNLLRITLPIALAMAMFLAAPLAWCQPDSPGDYPGIYYHYSEAYQHNYFASYDSLDYLSVDYVDSDTGVDLKLPRYVHNDVEMERAIEQNAEHIVVMQPLDLTRLHDRLIFTSARTIVVRAPVPINHCARAFADCWSLRHRHPVQSVSAPSCHVLA